MDEVERFDIITKNESYNKLIYRLGYLSPEIFRDVEILLMFLKLKKETDYYNYEIHSIIGQKYNLHKDHIRRILTRLLKSEIVKPTN